MAWQVNVLLIMYCRYKVPENNKILFPWDETNKTEDEKLSAWMVSDNGKCNYNNII